MLAWAKPTNPGVRPRKSTFAGKRPMLAATESVAGDSRSNGAAWPVPTGGFTGPCPVKKTTITLPRASGLFGPLMVLPSWFKAMARCVPGNKKIPTAAEATLKVSDLLVPALVVTTAVAVPGAVSKGTWALICPGETKKSGAGVPFTVTAAPANCVGKGTSDAKIVSAARFTPKIEMIDPGATGTGDGAKLAPLTMPPGV